MNIVRSSDVFLIFEVQSQVFPSSKPIVYIECPTSRATVFHNFLKLHEKFPKQFASFVPLGSRVDMLSGVLIALTKKWPSRPIFVVQMSVGK